VNSDIPDSASSALPLPWRCGAFTLALDEPLIMGILNVTPDSFSDGGTHNALPDAVDFAQQMVDAGARIIDVGGESTRPGSDEVTPEEELSRVLPVVRVLADRRMIVSIDTRHASVAQACVEAGAAIINDITGFRDEAMRQVACNCDAGVVVMHMRGEPKTMQNEICYADVVAEVAAYLADRAHELEAEGIYGERICLDPGPGFGKTALHNLALLARTDELVALGYPLMAAYSRKGFIGACTDVEVPAQRVAGSVAAALWALQGGAHVFRVHDVKATHEAFALWRAVQRAC
jgi:dihydropteroate synthase